MSGPRVSNMGKIREAYGAHARCAGLERQGARLCNARYLFWGREEKANYAQSKRPWEQESKLVATGAWGSIYDLESPREPVPPLPIPAVTPIPSVPPSPLATPSPPALQPQASSSSGHSEPSGSPSAMSSPAP